jgi:hypothetical protein
MDKVQKLNSNEYHASQEIITARRITVLLPVWSFVLHIFDFIEMEVILKFQENELF